MELRFILIHLVSENTKERGLIACFQLLEIVLIKNICENCEDMLLYILTQKICFCKVYVCFSDIFPIFFRFFQSVIEFYTTDR